ncbi:MAG: UbiA family prenyltransferase [Planctomycetota bacterium]
MNRRFRAYLELVRAPNLFTAAADSLAGFLYVGGTSSNFFDAAALVFASVFLYAGGVALNDVCDANVDRVERPGRPIPSRRISRREATTFAIGLLAVGFALSAAVSWAALWVTGIVIAFITLYDTVLKSTATGYAVMGLCRAGNLYLGMSWSGASFDWEHILPLAVMWFYVTSLTYFAKQEAGISSSRRLIWGTWGMAISVVSFCGLNFLLKSAWASYLLTESLQASPFRVAQAEACGSDSVFGCALIAGVLIIVLISSGNSANQDRRPEMVQKAVKAAILGIVLLDACFVVTTRGLPTASLVVLLIVPAIATARFGRMT